MSRFIGPQLPFERKNDEDLSEDETRDKGSEKEDEDEDVYGPALPPQFSSEESTTKSNEDDTLTDREQWLSAACGGMVKPNKLKSNQSKRPELSEKERKAIEERDARYAEYVAEYNREKRPMSLLELHQMNRVSKKQKKTNDERTNDRQPLDFDPESDLQVRRMSRRQTAAVVNSAKMLDNRFAGGSQRFL